MRTQVLPCLFPRPERGGIRFSGLTFALALNLWLTVRYLPDDPWDLIPGKNKDISLRGPCRDKTARWAGLISESSDWFIQNVHGIILPWDFWCPAWFADSLLGQWVWVMAPVSKKCGVQGCPITSEDSSCLWKRELVMECIRVHGHGFPHFLELLCYTGPSLYKLLILGPLVLEKCISQSSPGKQKWQDHSFFLSFFVSLSLSLSLSLFLCTYPPIYPSVYLDLL